VSDGATAALEVNETNAELSGKQEHFSAEQQQDNPREQEGVATASNSYDMDDDNQRVMFTVTDLSSFSTSESTAPVNFVMAEASNEDTVLMELVVNENNTCSVSEPSVADLTTPKVVSVTNDPDPVPMTISSIVESRAEDIDGEIVDPLEGMNEGVNVAE
jgi:hypothetical protein